MPHEKAREVIIQRVNDLTDQQIANLLLVTEIFGDMSAPALQFLRSIGTEENRVRTDFLLNAKPATLTFLAEARPEEIQNLKEGIRLVVASQLVGRVVKWGAVTFFGVVMAAFALFEVLNKIRSPK